MIFATSPSDAMCVLATIYPNKSQKQKTKKEKTNIKWANWFIYWPKPYFLLSTTCDEILSWMIDIWMTNHLVSEGYCNTVIPRNFDKEWQIMLG
jgi:hypothetical protein